MRSSRSLGPRLLDLRLVLVAGAAALVAAPASGDIPDDDGAPRGTVAYFSGVSACPMGWKAPDYAAGRLIAGTSTADYVGVTVGKPLGDREDRTHTHPYSTKVKLPFKAISGADGSTQDGAAATEYTVSGETSAAASGLPFIQLLACEKQ